MPGAIAGGSGWTAARKPARSSVGSPCLVLDPMTPGQELTLNVFEEQGTRLMIRRCLRATRAFRIEWDWRDPRRRTDRHEAREETAVFGGEAWVRSGREGRRRKEDGVERRTASKGGKASKRATTTRARVGCSGTSSPTRRRPEPGAARFTPITRWSAR